LKSNCRSPPWDWKIYLCALFAAVLWCLVILRGNTAEPCNGFATTAKKQCEARLANFKAIPEDQQQPYWASWAAASIKSYVSMVVLGPPSPGSEQAVSSTGCCSRILAPIKSWGKFRFQCCLLVLCLFNVVVDATRLPSVYGQSDFAFCTLSIILTASGNLATTFVAQSMYSVLDGKQTWEFLHTDDPDAVSVGPTACAQFHA